MYKPLLIIFGLAALGALFVGQGITGMAVSESCCFPPDCDSANLCPASHGGDQLVSEVGLLLIGAAVVMVSLLFAYFWHTAANRGL